MSIIEKFNIIMPWPILYEILRTKFVKNKLWLTNFERLLSYLKVIYVHDDNYRDKALLEAFGYGKRNISLVDTVIRLMLRDLSLRVDYLITYNENDFIDICKLRKIPIYYIQD